MNLADFKILMESESLPKSAYDHFKKPPEAPYLVFGEDPKSIFWADNQKYHIKLSYIVILYTRLKDPAAEKVVQDVLELSGAEVIISPDEWDDDRSLFRTEFTVRY